jgi:hypothetical protein
MVGSGFIDHPLYGQERDGAEAEFARTGGCQSLRLGKRTLLRLSGSKSGSPMEPVALLFADAELADNGLVPFRVVFLQVVEQAATPAHHHEKSAARAVIFQVRFEVFRQLTDALAQQRDLNFRAPSIGRMRAVRVNDGLLLLSG